MNDHAPRPARPEAHRVQVALRLSLAYAAAFAVLGVYMPYWPLWLQGRGLRSEAIAWVMSAQILARTVAGPLWAQHADHTGRPARVLRRLGWLSCLLLPAFAWVDSLGGLLLCSLAFGVVYSPLHAILDTLALGHATRLGFPYTRVRIWGSIAFLLVSIAAGLLLRRLGGDATVVLWLVLAGLLATASAGSAVPEQAVTSAPAAGRGAIRQLLGNGPFVLFLLATGLLQGSHAAYYGFATLHWRQHGLSEATCGLLWAEGVLAEIVLFALLPLWRRRPSARALLLVGAAGAVLRWLLLAATTDPVWLFLVNWLHAASFGMCYLGAVQHIAGRVPPALAATAQGLVGAACSGVFLAIGTEVAGRTHAIGGGQAFVAMAGMALLGGVLAACCRDRRGSGATGGDRGQQQRGEAEREQRQA